MAVATVGTSRERSCGTIPELFPVLRAQLQGDVRAAHQIDQPGHGGGVVQLDAGFAVQPLLGGVARGVVAGDDQACLGLSRAQTAEDLDHKVGALARRRIAEGAGPGLPQHQGALGRARLGHREARFRLHELEQAGGRFQPGAGGDSLRAARAPNAGACVGPGGQRRRRS
jgi:hypothetical protein